MQGVVLLTRIACSCKQHTNTHPLLITTTGAYMQMDLVLTCQAGHLEMRMSALSIGVLVPCAFLPIWVPQVLNAARHNAVFLTAAAGGGKGTAAAAAAQTTAAAAAAGSQAMLPTWLFGFACGSAAATAAALNYLHPHQQQQQSLQQQQQLVQQQWLSSFPTGQASSAGPPSAAGVNPQQQQQQQQQQQPWVQGGDLHAALSDVLTRIVAPASSSNSSSGSGSGSGSSSGSSSSSRMEACGHPSATTRGSSSSRSGVFGSMLAFFAGLLPLGSAHGEQQQQHCCLRWGERGDNRHGVSLQE